MSGIAAIWQLDGAPLAVATLDRVAARLSPPSAGPAGTWLDGPVGLAHRALFTTPESPANRRPRYDETRGVVVTADARLDNRDALLAELGLPRNDADKFGDDDLILEAWCRWSESCPDHLLGDFAFVVWDARQRTIFCARDPSSIKPLCYHLGPRIFAAASATAPLLAVPGIDRRLDELEIATMLVPILHNRTRTSFEGIVRLPGGHSLTVTTGGHAVRTYWQLDPTRASRARSDDEYAEAFRELFTDAVHVRLRSAAPVAAALSGGLDSSSVVTVARAVGQHAGSGPLPVYTARFPTLPGCDESAYTAAVIDQGGLTSLGIAGDQLDPLGDLEDAPGRGDETCHAAGYYMHGALYRAAAANGHRVFLEGTAGDSVVSHGLGHLYDLARAWRWLAFVRQVRALSASLRSPWRRSVRPAAVMMMPTSVRLNWRRLQYRGIFGAAIVSKAFAKRIDLDARLRDTLPPRCARDIEGARYHHWRTLVSPRLAHVQETLAAAAAASGVELRDPFADRRLIEFCLALPASQKIREGLTRVVLRHALDPLLPALVRDRPGKARLDLMFGAAFSTYGPERLDRLMRQAPDVLGPYVRKDFIERAYQSYREKRSPADRQAVWRIATVTLWLQRAAR